MKRFKISENGIAVLVCKIPQIPKEFDDYPRLKAQFLKRVERFQKSNAPTQLKIFVNIAAREYIRTIKTIHVEDEGF